MLSRTEELRILNDRKKVIDALERGLKPLTITLSPDHFLYIYTPLNPANPPKLTDEEKSLKDIFTRIYKLKEMINKRMLDPNSQQSEVLENELKDLHTKLRSLYALNTNKEYSNYFYQLPAVADLKILLPLEANDQKSVERKSTVYVPFETIKPLSELAAAGTALSGEAQSTVNAFKLSAEQLIRSAFNTKDKTLKKEATRYLNVLMPLDPHFVREMFKQELFAYKNLRIEEAHGNPLAAHFFHFLGKV